MSPPKLRARGLSVSNDLFGVLAQVVRPKNPTFGSPAKDLLSSPSTNARYSASSSRVSAPGRPAMQVGVPGRDRPAEDAR
eukprot:scaffold7210_cov32-Tisochrysis_lutea.AAC.2